MPHRSDHMDTGDDMTQQSGYAPQSGSGDAARYAGGPSQDYGQTQERTRSAVREAQDTARDYGQRTKQQAEAGIDKAAEGMQSTAEALREKASERGGKTAEYGTRAADAMEKSAQYLREHDTDQIVDDVEQYIKQHPVQAIAGAVVGGFIIGRLLG